MRRSSTCRWSFPIVRRSRPGVYTQNLVFAAPVALDRARTPAADIRAVVINSGNANACTGERGLRDAEEMARAAAADLRRASETQALVLSTGVIGAFLPMDKIVPGIQPPPRQLGSRAKTALRGRRARHVDDRHDPQAGRATREARRARRFRSRAWPRARR